MKWGETVASKCRWGHIVKGFLDKRYGAVEVVWEESENDYQGSAKFLAKVAKTNKYVYYEWTYGSCEGCDTWHNQDVGSIETEIEKTIAEYTFDGLKNWLTMLEDRRNVPDWDDSRMEAIRREVAPHDL